MQQRRQYAMLGLQSNPQQRQRGGSTQTGRAESESESECSWQVRYLRLHKSGWQKHKFPHVASIREFPDSSTPHHQFLCITEPSTGRVQVISADLKYRSIFLVRCRLSVFTNSVFSIKIINVTTTPIARLPTNANHSQQIPLTNRRTEK